LCFWRCLAKHLNPKVAHRKLIRISKKLCNEFYNKTHKNYEGVNVTEFDDIERKFNIEIRYYELHVRTVADDKEEVEATKKTIM